MKDNEALNLLNHNFENIEAKLHSLTNQQVEYLFERNHPGEVSPIFLLLIEIKHAIFQIKRILEENNSTNDE